MVGGCVRSEDSGSDPLLFGEEKSYIPDLDTGVKEELVDCGNGMTCTCWILRNGRDPLRDWLG